MLSDGSFIYFRLNPTRRYCDFPVRMSDIPISLDACILSRRTYFDLEQILVILQILWEN